MKRNLFFLTIAVIIYTYLQSCSDSSESQLGKVKISSVASLTKNVAECLASPPSRSAFKPTVLNKKTNNIHPPKNMVWVPGGEFSMGSLSMPGMPMDGGDPTIDAQPVHQVYVDGFYMDAAEVTNAQFAEFVKATGYITVAEQKPTKEEFPDAKEESLFAGAIVFTPPSHNVPLDNFYQWWSYVGGANWRHPTGPKSSIRGKDNFPVVQIAWEDAAAYAKWARKRLPTEAEWEFAARGGKAGELYCWGNEYKPGGQWMANTFQGQFPVKDIGEDGFVGIAPVKSFSPNVFGLYDMAGNVWEWCNDWYSTDYYKQLASTGLTKNPQGPALPFDSADPETRKKVERGGSFLCTSQYCSRYMVGTRGKGEWRSSANHIGFRCVKDIQ